MNEDLTQLWMVPYADLMSTMVLLFMSLFAYAYAQRSPEYDRTLARIEKELAVKDQSQRSQEKLDETELAVKIEQRLKGLALKDFGVQVTARYVRLTLPAPVLFEEGSTRLSPEAGGVLAPLADILSGVDNPVLVEGHTDNVPIVGGRLRSNWELSAARSFSVIEFLMSRGLPAARFNPRGYGEHRPVAGNDTAEGRAKNRRIEISLIRKLEKNAS